METKAKIQLVQPVTDPPQPLSTPGSRPSPSPQSRPASPSAPAYIAEPADDRLVVDKDPVRGRFIYRTVDRLTGETVAQLANEDIIRLRDSDACKAGTVFNGKA